MKKILKIGELRLHRDGYGFVITADPDEDDIFIPARFVGDALHTDVVEVLLLPGKGKKTEGRIQKVLERRVTQLVGRVEQQGKHFFAIADDLRVRRRISIAAGKLNGARHGQNVVIKLTHYPRGQEPMQGEVVKVLGKRGELTTEKSAVIVHHNLPLAFPAKVIKDADACFLNISTSGREDLRKIDFVTIDGETARDFDDAVAVKKLENGLIRLWVSIADVSYFVRENSALDHEAYARGTSVYFPNECLPMLPPQLSNELCSLKPQENRLTMTAEMDIDHLGNVTRSVFYNSIINSRERMTYTAVKKILLEKDQKTRERYKNLLHNFDIMQECFERLRKKRIERGSMDFDLPEPSIVINLTGTIEDIVRSERHVGHMMIEEFMIAANESVAEFLTKKKMGCIYRVHDHPPKDKLYEFSVLLHNLGYKIKFGEHVPTKKMAEIINMVSSKPEERLVNTSLLRSLAKAVYSENNVGHYGLASKCYCHFTSPIRRYPDLVVHRLLKIALKHPQKVSGLGSQVSGLKEISAHCTRRERIAMEAERETMKLYIAFFMKDKIGEIFEGIISHVTKFGFFVELNDFFVEGLVHKDGLPRDYYTFNESGYSLDGKKNKTSFRIGKPVKVVVKEVDVTNREVFFSLV